MLVEMRYLKQIANIYAVQFTNENKDRLLCYLQEIQQNIHPSTDNKGRPVLVVPAVMGGYVCEIGDYIIKEPFPIQWQHFYVLKKDEFEQMYAPVETNKPATGTLQQTLLNAAKEVDSWPSWKKEALGKLLS